MLTLINPPFVSLWRPNLGLSLLKAQLRRDGHPCRIDYADHALALRLGRQHYGLIEADHGAMMGEWLFSGFVRANGQWNLDYPEWLLRRGTPPAQVETLQRWVRELPDYLAAVVDRVLADQPTVVGCSSTFQQNNASLAILKEIKRRRPSVVTVMGGANLEGELGVPIVSRYPWVDYVVSGEAEGCISRGSIPVFMRPPCP